MEDSYTANISAFMRGVKRDSQGWHQYINYGDYAFAIALRESYFPVTEGWNKVKLLFKRGDVSRNQDPDILYLEEVEFPHSLELKNIALDSKGETIPIMQHLQNRAEKLGMQFAEPRERVSTATNSKSINLTQKGGNYALGNGALAKLTNKLLGAHIDFTSRRILKAIRADLSYDKSPPIENYKIFLGNLLEVAGIENWQEVVIEAVKHEKVDGVTNRETALARATEHAKEILPQTNMYITTKFKLDGKEFEVPKPVQREAPKWVGAVASALGIIASALGTQSEGR